MIPRLTIEDPEDAATVMIALLHFSRVLVHRAIDHGDASAIPELRRTAELLDLSREELIRSEVGDPFAEMTDDQIGDMMENMRSEFGDSPDA